MILCLSCRQRKKLDYTQLECPFTFTSVTMRCNVCGCCVADSGFHIADKQAIEKAFFGNSVICWDLAAEAVTHEADIPKARARLDSILEFKGNYLNNAISPSCIGCATWARTNAVIPRTAVVHACFSMILGMSPYAFGAGLAQAGIPEIKLFLVGAR